MADHRFHGLILLSLLVLMAPATRLLANEGMDQVSCASGPLHQSGQIVVSVAPHWNSKSARLIRFNRSGSGQGWNQVDREPVQAVIGKNGMGWGLGEHPGQSGEYTKKEGDGRSPAGIFSLVDSFGYHSADQAGADAGGLPYHQVDENSKCVDDEKSRHYNRNVYDIRQVERDWAPGVEDLRRADPLYEYAITVDHNGASSGQAVRGGGSCIFMHVWRGPDSGTAGCTAMEASRMRELLGWMKASSRPKLVQLPLADYLAHQKEWCLPALPDELVLKMAAEAGGAEVSQALAPSAPACPHF